MRLLAECGFSDEDSLALLRPLIQNNVAQMLHSGTVDALTGPVERGDTETVQKHLDTLRGGSAEAVYRDLGNVLVDLAKRRHPEWDDTAMRECFHNYGG